MVVRKLLEKQKTASTGGLAEIEGGLAGLLHTFGIC